MLLTDHLAPGVAADLEAKGIAYVDAAGNAYLNGPAAYVLTRGQRPERPAARTGLTATDLKLVFAILCRPEILHEPLRHIATTTGISLGKVSTTLRRLGDLDHIREIERQRVLHNPPRLLHRWEVGYLEAVRPRLNPTTWRRPNHTSLDEASRSALALPDVLPALIREHPGAPSTQPNSSPACASIVRTNRPLGRLTPPASRQVPENGE